jgi:hypothetical protein
MEELDLFSRVLELREKGMNYCEISRETGVNRRTLMDWCKGNVDRDKLKLKHTRAKVNDETFEKFVKESISVSEVLNKSELKQQGGNYKAFYNRVKRLNLSTEHFKGQGYLKGKHNPYVTEVSPEEAFVRDGDLGTSSLRRKILKFDLKKYECEECQMTEWRGKKLSLHLDHIDGDNRNNLLENLRFLCPNCHSLTETYCGKNKGKKN